VARGFEKSHAHAQEAGTILADARLRATPWSEKNVAGGPWRRGVLLMLAWILATAFLCLALALIGLGGFAPLLALGDGIFMLLSAMAATALVCALEGYATE
jgi:hypothetical protein